MDSEILARAAGPHGTVVGVDLAECYCLCHAPGVITIAGDIRDLGGRGRDCGETHPAC